MMLHPTPTTIGGKTYILSKFPATVGREILMQYPTSALPKIGEYKTNHALMVKIMGYVGVEIEGRQEPLMLSSEALIDNHVADATTLVQLEWAMVTLNFPFLTNGGASGLLDWMMEKFNLSISKILTDLPGQLLAKGTPPSKS